MHEIKPLFIMAVKGDSKRLPRKNLKMIGGKSLFIHAFNIMIAASKKYRDSKVIFASESGEVFFNTFLQSKYSNKLFNKFYLTKKEARDPYQLGDICKLILDKYESSLDDYWPLVMVQATNPFILEEDIHKCVDIFVKQTGMDSVRAVKELNQLWRRLTIVGMHKLDDGIGIVKSIGSVVVCNPKYVKHMGSFPLTATIPYFLPKERAIDINDELDFLYAEAVMEKYKKC